MSPLSFTSDQLQLQDPKKFCADIEFLVENKNMSYIDAICHLCELKSIEVEMAATILNPSITENIRREATGLNMIPKTACLPF